MAQIVYIISQSVSPHISQSVSPHVSQSVSPHVSQSVSPHISQSVSPHILRHYKSLYKIYRLDHLMEQNGVL